jgi:hypothetical protein
MSEIKTVTHKGKVYQIGKDYLFSNDGDQLIYGQLKAICPQSGYPFATHDEGFYKYIGLISDCKSQGTITPAPIELDHGKAYMFDCHPDTNIIGVYQQSTKRMLTVYGYFPKNELLNIKPMTVGSE